MAYIKGITFGYCAPKGAFLKKSSKKSLELLKKHTDATHVVFAVVALQATAQATNIDFFGSHIVSDDELIDMIEYAKAIGLKPILKPMVNVKDGTWRAHINFFDHDIPCEPKWKDWFANYQMFLNHYAVIAEETRCEMFVIGCEMVQSERREEEWRKLINNIRPIYKGPITYNTDKYQEDHIKWWDAVDIISSSGYYPIDDWEQQLNRIEVIVKIHKKPFVFMEVGCSSKEGASLRPNDWTINGSVNLEEQRDYYDVMFENVAQRDWVQGLVLWDWNHHLYPRSLAKKDTGYALYGKLAELSVKKFFSRL